MRPWKRHRFRAKETIVTRSEVIGMKQFGTGTAGPSLKMLQNTGRSVMGCIKKTNTVCIE